MHPNATTTKPAEKNNQTGVGRTSTAGYTLETTNELLRDLNFIVTKDYINRKLKGYDDILPTTSYSLTNKVNKTFIFIFDKGGLEFEVIASIDVVNMNVTIVHEIQLGGEPQVAEEPQRTYSALTVDEANKSFYYLVAMGKLEKLTESKYKDAKVESVGINEEEADVIHFRNVFVLSEASY